VASGGPEWPPVVVHGVAPAATTAADLQRTDNGALARSWWPALILNNLLNKKLSNIGFEPKTFSQMQHHKPLHQYDLCDNYLFILYINLFCL